ncbi:hypothetical protein KIW84_010102 [Lathyrus oleraceus]|uniref:Reverse transcriptase/retrotransposon-derived protein RNase H-like domain-containing protein n=1 Tax=Pisum sativum TaxID=3888 RepID=A0A9D4YL77_PEA|nr:hypothetical protein KIW84_010102 [Pisum sativum]
MTATCVPIFKLLRKDQSCDWTEDCQKAFGSIKEYLLEPPILSPPVEGRSLIMYLTVLEDSMGCVLGQQDETGKKEFAIYYLSMNFTDCSILVDHLAHQPIEDYQSVQYDFPDEEILYLKMKDCDEPLLEEGPESSSRWGMVFDGAVNQHGNGIGEMIITS